MHNQKGSALIWSAVVGMVMSILVVSLCTMALAYHKRTLNTIADDQIYLTSRSVLERLAKEIVAETEFGTLFVDRLTLSPEKTYTISDIAFDEAYAPRMGETSVAACMTGAQEILLTASTRLNERQGELRVYLSKRPQTSGGSLFPSLYTPEEYVFREWPEPTDKTVYLRKPNGSPHTPVVLGSTDNTDTYYYVDEFSNFDKQGSIQVQGSGNIYLFVRDNCTGRNGFFVDEVTAAAVTDSLHMPTLYIIVGENAAVTLNEFRTDHTTVNAYIYSPYESSTVTLGKNKNNATVFNGSIISKSPVINNIGDQNFEATYTKPYKEPYISAGEGGNAVLRWEVVKFEK